MPDYPGFGKSTGKLSEQILYDEALQVYKWPHTIPAGTDYYLWKIVRYGIAAQLASIRDCRRLILETPYYSITSLKAYMLDVRPLKCC